MKKFNARSILDEWSVSQDVPLSQQAAPPVQPDNFYITRTGTFQLEPLPDYGDLMTLEEFKEMCQSGMFIDYDGFGQYAILQGMSNLVVKPSDYPHSIENEWTHVVWFNR